MIPHLTVSDAIEDAKLRAKSRPTQVDVYDREGKVIKRIATIASKQSLSVTERTD